MDFDGNVYIVGGKCKFEHIAILTSLEGKFEHIAHVISPLTILTEMLTTVSVNFSTLLMRFLRERFHQRPRPGQSVFLCGIFCWAHKYLFFFLCFSFIYELARYNYRLMKINKIPAYRLHFSGFLLFSCSLCSQPGAQSLSFAHSTSPLSNEHAVLRHSGGANILASGQYS